MYSGYLNWKWIWSFVNVKVANVVFLLFSRYTKICVQTNAEGKIPVRKYVDLLFMKFPTKINKYM